MGAAIGQVLSLGVAVAISPIPIIGVVLMLTTPRARSNGPAFLLGWVVGLAVLGTAMLLVAGDSSASENGGPATWVSVLKLVLGCLLLLTAVRQWRGRPHDVDEVELPGWMRAVDRISAVRSGGMGTALAAVNPKNGLLTIAAGAAIAQTGVGAGKQAVALAVFIVVATMGVATPVIAYYLLGDRSDRMLSDLKDFLAVHNAAIVAVLLVVIGVKLIGDGITGLA